MTDHTEPILNGDRLRQAREDLDMSQDGFAKAIRIAASRSGHPMRATKRLIQKWEAGEHLRPHRHYQTAIAAVTGIPYCNLCKGSSPLDPEDAAQKLEQIQRDLLHLAERVESVLRDIRLSAL